MKATQYSTNKYGELLKGVVRPAVSMAGATVAVKADAPANTDFLGFGIAITGSSCYILNKMEPAKRRKILEDLFSKNGMGLSVGRLTVGSTDYSAELYTYDDFENDTSLSHFSIDRDREYIIPVIKEIMAINPEFTFFASPWTPPAWMKAGNSACGGYMREEYLDCYGDYIVKYIKAYEAQGIKISAITPQNEPETSQDGKMPACVWHPDIESKFIRILREKFDENGIDTGIWCYDHNFAGANLVEWCFEKYPYLKDDCEGIAFHYYAGTIENTVFLKELYPDLTLHFTEGGPRLFDNYDTDWCKWSLMMVKALNCRYSSFTGWNIILDEHGGPNIGPYYCGGLITENSISGELSYSGQYKAFKHIAPFIDKTSKIYPLKFLTSGINMFEYPCRDNGTVEGSLVENSDGTKTLIVVNPNDRKLQFQYFEDGTLWYAEILPDTVATIHFEK